MCALRKERQERIKRGRESREFIREVGKAGLRLANKLS